MQLLSQSGNPLLALNQNLSQLTLRHFLTNKLTLLLKTYIKENYRESALVCELA